VEVAYALRDRQALLALELEDGGTVEHVIRHSGILEAFPEIDIARSQVGIFGRAVSLDTRVRDGDRVEIYRPLIADPKDARRKRAQRTKR
jgi:putative ubiquitin-RnfH superfamily antitoxin RatB of RatAB toxin-antitoxin module